MALGLNPLPKLTPMMEQYQAIKKTLPTDTFLFFRLGDFYEMFFEDALKASEILEITLTGREGGEAGRVPMCGVPYHSYQGYVKTLLDHQWKVAICEQIGDPAVKWTKGIVERKVTRIITPASYLEDETPGQQAEYMTALLASGERFGLAYLDLGTGKFYVREIPEDRLLSELCLLNPREIALPSSLARKANWLESLKKMLFLTVTVYEDWIFHPSEGSRLLSETFRLGSERALSFCDQPLLVGAAGAILYYLRDHLHEALDHLQIPELLDHRDFMVLDLEVQRSLELVSSFSGRKDAPTLYSVLDRTLTSMGARALQDWITHPLIVRAAIEKRQGAVSEMMRDRGRLDALRHLLKGIRDIERTLGRLNYGVASARDLVNLREFLHRAPQLRSAVILNPVVGGAKDLKTEMLQPSGPQDHNSNKVPLLQELADQIKPFPHLEDLIRRAIVDEPPLGVRDGGMIRSGFSKELDDLCEIEKGGKNWILEFEKREVARTGIKSLKVKYSQVFGYTIEISKTNLHLAPTDYIRRQTLANAERFIVPELKAWDEKISGAEDRIKAMEYELFNEVRRTVLQSLVPLQKMAQALGQLDALVSLAGSALEREWIRPSISEERKLHIQGGRHPVVESTLASGAFIPNDTFLEGSAHQLIVLTGPNMAGKSTYIRQIAQLVVLAQIGSYLPAQAAEIGIVDRIFTRVGSRDDLARGESTFMVEMLETAKILRNATERSLLILDEVGRGTSTFDGVSIAWAICENLATSEIRPRTLFATHYHELTQLEDHFPGIKNYQITVRETESGIVFLRKVQPGGSDRSYGIHVARLAGIPDTVTRRAEEILRILESENTQATELIEARHSKPQKDKIAQASLWDAVRENHPLIEEIKKKDIDSLTPLEALNLIAEWKQKI